MEVKLKMKNCVGIKTLVKKTDRALNGKFFLCRTITPSSKLDDRVQAAVEDVEGKTSPLALFFYSVDAKTGKSDFEAVLPLGTIVVVKNPIFGDVGKFFGNSPDVAVVAGNPANVELLSPKRMKALFPGVRWKCDLQYEKMLNSSPVWEFTPDQSDVEIATKLKNVGNKAFVENRSTDAIRFYDLALEYLPEITPAASAFLPDILSNKAAALIKLGCFNPALICTAKALGINPGHVKAIYRHAKALIGLERYAESGQFLDEKLSQIPSLGQENQDIVKLRSIIPELGKPPGKEIIAAMQRPWPQPALPVGMMDRISEYRGPVEVGPSKVGEGEGLFATEDLAVGTVLLVCKPFVSLHVKSLEKKAFLLNTSTKEYLIGTMTNKVRLDPQLGRDLYPLWAGPELKSLTDKDDPNITKLDILRITKISAHNLFICHVNNLERDEDADGYPHMSCGIWIAASKINHSCFDANVMFGHHKPSMVMMVTTFKEVKKGEEIVASYVPAMWPLSERILEYSHGFICKCRLCELDRSESAEVIAKRDQLIESLAGKYSNGTGFQTIRELDWLRSATPDLNFALASPEVFEYASIFLQPNEELCKLSLFILEKVYTVVKNVPPNYVDTAYAETILVCCMKMGEKKAVLEKWVEEVRKYCRLYAGTLEHVRAGRHPTIPEDLKKFGIEFFNEAAD